LLAIHEMETVDPVVYTNLGTIAFMKDKNFAEAERYYRKAIDLGSTDQFNAYSNLVMAQLVQRKEQMAAASFEQALQFGSNRSILSNLYSINKSIGNQEKMNFYANQLSQK
jgi:Flp pilus assembly protein TadD